MSQPKAVGWLWPRRLHIDDGDQIVQLINAGQRSRFPDRTFGALAIAHQDVGAVIQLVQSRAKRHAHAHAQTLAQRTGRHIHKRQPRRRVPSRSLFNSRNVFKMFPRERPTSAQAE